MAKEIRSTSVGAQQVADRVHSAAIHLLRRVRKVDDTSGLTAARLSALSVAVFGGSTTLGALARAEQVSAPTMSRLVQGLERDGLVTREAHERDGRSVLVRATAKGRRILVQGRERRISELVRLFESLSPEDLARLDAAAAIVEDILGVASIRPKCVCWRYRGKEVVRLER